MKMATIIAQSMSINENCSPVRGRRERRDMLGLEARKCLNAKLTAEHRGNEELEGSQREIVTFRRERGLRGAK